MLDGETLFQVARDKARPFRVDTGRTMVQAIGTQFRIYRKDTETMISDLEGVVELSGESAAVMVPAPESQTTLRSIPVPTAPARISAGEELLVAADGVTVRQEADPARATAWRQRRLIFRKDTLSDIAEEFNRYNRSPQIRVEGEQARSLRFTGAFDADDPHSLLEYLARNPSLVFETRDSELVIRQRNR